MKAVADLARRIQGRLASWLPARTAGAALLIAILAGCQTSLSRPAQLLIVGDSLAQGYVVGFGRVVAPHGDAEMRLARIDDLVFIGAGIIPRSRRDLPALLAQRLDHGDPVDAVIVSAGINDVGMPLGAVTFYGETWRARYQERVNALIDVAADRSVPVLWLEVPAIRDARFADVLDQTIRPLQAAVVNSRPAHVRLVETLPLTTMNGRFAASMPDGSGGTVRMRTGDGIHFTATGYTRIGAAAIDVLEDWLGRDFRPTVSWQSAVAPPDAALTVLAGLGGGLEEASLALRQVALRIAAP